MAISKHDKQALSDLFIHMGVPLMTAMQTVESWSGGGNEDLSVRAETLSKLLNVSVDFATKITKKLEIRDAYTLEQVRGKIIRIITPIIAESYTTNGEIPSEDSLEDLTNLFDVLLSFADSVSPTDNRGSKPVKMAAMVEACEPIIAAIRQSDFGIGEEKAFQNSVMGLQTRAEQLASVLGVENAIEDGLFQSLVSIYVSCYKQLSDKNGSIDDVWEECDQRLALIHGLSQFVADKAGIETKPISAVAETKKEDKKVTTPSTDSKPSNGDGQEAKEAQLDNDNDDDDDEGDDSNPMSFFSAGG